MQIKYAEYVFTIIHSLRKNYKNNVFTVLENIKYTVTAAIGIKGVSSRQVRLIKCD